MFIVLGIISVALFLVLPVTGVFIALTVCAALDASGFTAAAAVVVTFLVIFMVQYEAVTAIKED